MTPDKITPNSGKTTSLQSFVELSARRCAVGAVNGMKRDIAPNYTLRQFMEEAVRHYAQHLADQHRKGELWPEEEDLDRSGRGAGRGRQAA